MAFDISWLFDQRILYVRMYDNIEMWDVEQLSQSFSAYYSEGIPPVYVVLDTLKIRRAPISLDEIKKMNIDSYSKATTLVLGDNATARLVASLVVQLISSDFRFVSSFKEALTTLYQIEPELKALGLNQIVLKN